MNFENFDEFTTAIMDSLQDNLSGNEKLSVETVIKNNDEKMTAISIQVNNANIGPRIYVDGAYDAYMNGTSFDEIVDNMIKTVNDALSNGAALKVSMDDIRFFDKIKPILKVKLINEDMNYEYLKDKPYRSITNGIAAIAYIDVGSDPYKGSAVCYVTNQMLSTWGVTDDEVFDVAINNIKESDYVMIPLERYLVEYMGIPEFMVGMPEGPSPMSIVTNKTNMYGASMILNDNVKTDILNDFGEDHVIIPSSIHEMLVIRCPYTELSKDQINNIVKEVNGTVVKPSEVLSNFVYHVENDGRLAVA